MKLLMVFAEFERASIAGRIRDAYDKRSNMGLYAGGRRVYGYDLEEDVIHGVKTKKFVPNAGEAAAHIEYIFAAYSRPGVTLGKVRPICLQTASGPLPERTGRRASLAPFCAIRSMCVRCKRVLNIIVAGTSGLSMM